MHQTAMRSTKDEGVDADAEVRFAYLPFFSLNLTLTMNVQAKLSGVDFDAARVDFIMVHLEVGSGAPLGSEGFSDGRRRGSKVQCIGGGREEEGR